MALPVGFAEMPKADVVSLRSPRRPRFPDCVFGAIPNDAAMGEQDMPFGAEALPSRTRFLPDSHNASTLNYTGQNYEKNAI